MGTFLLRLGDTPGPSVVIVILLLAFGPVSILALPVLAARAPVKIVPIEVTNNQVIPTGTFQQKVVINSLAYSSWINPNWTNVEFENGDGSAVPTWIESGNSNSASSTVVWLRLNSINPLATLTLYMDIFSLTVNLLSASGPIGEAPQLSPVWGQYDDGVQVFNAYANFQGSSQPLQWDLQGGAKFVGGANSTGGVQLMLGGACQEGAVSYENAVSGPNLVIQFSGAWNSGGLGPGFGIGFLSSGPAASSYQPWPMNGYMALFPPGGTPALYHSTNQISSGGTVPDTTFLFGQVITGQKGISVSGSFRSSAPYETPPSVSLANYINFTGSLDNSNNVLYVEAAADGCSVCIGNCSSNAWVYWIRSIVYESVAPTVVIGAQTYTATFTESGLPSGTSWQVQVGSAINSSTSNTITFQLKNGTYSFSVSSVPGYLANPSGGPLIIAGSDISKSIDFTKNSFAVTFLESGLPTGSSWTVTLDGTPQSSTTSTVIFLNVTNGQHQYTVSASSGYAPSPPSGLVQVTGGDQTVPVSFVKNSFKVTFEETGLPSGLSWDIALDGSKLASSSSSIVFFSVPNGFHSYIVGAPFGYQASPPHGNFSVSGNDVNVSISFGLGWNLPSPPQNVSATGGIGFIRLSWTPPRSLGAPPGFTGTAVESYYIYRGSTPGSEKYYDKVSGTMLSYTDNSATAGEIFFYYVTAVNPVGQSSPSTESSAQAVLLTVPSVVQILIPPTVEGSGIYLSWKPPASNGGTQVTAYIVCRGTTLDSITDCATLPANDTSFTDTNGLSPGQTYYYTVKAVNSQGQGSPTLFGQIEAPQNIPGIPLYENLAIIGILTLVVGSASVGATFFVRERRRPDLEIYPETKPGWDSDPSNIKMEITVRNDGSKPAVNVGVKVVDSAGKPVTDEYVGTLETHMARSFEVKVNSPSGDHWLVTVVYQHPTDSSEKKPRQMTKDIKPPPFPARR
ncbi:MAG: fibronectin type III domain-containing protein [Thaumarchaeota archaeon]|nr:fibronectin type III domain-containing protein [Nitrososphaerota archaeon]